MSRFYSILILLILLELNITAQVQDSTITDSEANFEEFFEDSFTEESEIDAYDIFEDLLLNPIELNTAGINELSKIPFLDFNSASIITAHRNKYGHFNSVNELFSISKLNSELVNKILPFVKVDKKSISDSTFEFSIDEESWFKAYINSFNIQIRSRIGSDLQLRDGFAKGNYTGSKLKSYNRILIKQSSDFQAGAITEKDAGEKSFVDYYSYHLSLRNYGILKHLVIGDYNLEFGQGLLLWSSYSLSKGSDATLPVKKNSRNLRPHTGASEYGFFRGIGFNFNSSDFNLLLFYSSKKIDANIDSTTLEIKSLPLTGIHATQNEISRKNAASEIVMGSRIEYSFNSSNKFGLTYYKSEFSNPFQKNSVFDLSGKNFSFYSFDFDNRFGPVNIFGEIANDKNNTAFYGGVIVSPFSKLQFVTSIRYYPKNFINLHAFGFGEQSGKTQNENGIYSGIKFNSEFGLFNIYYDNFKFPYSTYENPIPSTGNEFYLSYGKKINRDLELHLRYKTEKKEITESIDNLKHLTERIRNSYRFEFDYFISRQFKFRTRLEYNTYQIDKIDLFEKGFLIYEDVKISSIKDLTIYGRIILFNTDSFSSAVYEFENDLTGLFSNLAIYGEGLRYYFLIKYKVIKNISLSFKYAETYKPNEKFLSSGNNRINGNIDNRFNFQIDVSL